jgi:hypothetical protein
MTKDSIMRVFKSSIFILLILTNLSVYAQVELPPGFDDADSAFDMGGDGESAFDRSGVDDSAFDRSGVDDSAFDMEIQDLLTERRRIADLEKENKLVEDFKGLWEVIDIIEACHEARKGYMAVYINDDQISDVRTKYNTMRSSFVKQSHTLSKLSESGEIDEYFRKESYDESLMGTVGDLYRRGAQQWSKAALDNCQTAAASFFTFVFPMWQKGEF